MRLIRPRSRAEVQQQAVEQQVRLPQVAPPERAGQHRQHHAAGQLQPLAPGRRPQPRRQALAEQSQVQGLLLLEAAVEALPGLLELVQLHVFGRGHEGTPGRSLRLGAPGSSARRRPTVSWRGAGRAANVRRAGGSSADAGAGDGAIGSACCSGCCGICGSIRSRSGVRVNRTLGARKKWLCRDWPSVRRSCVDAEVLHLRAPYQCHPWTQDLVPRCRKLREGNWFSEYAWDLP